MMLRQIGIILICSGMILSFTSTTQYDSIVNELVHFIRNQWPIVLIFIGFTCMIIHPNKTKKTKKKNL